jgi:hypothetical protein
VTIIPVPDFCLDTVKLRDISHVNGTACSLKDKHHG